jgi:hypothetical protein
MSIAMAGEKMKLDRKPSMKFWLLTATVNQVLRLVILKIILRRKKKKINNKQQRALA